MNKKLFPLFLSIILLFTACGNAGGKDSDSFAYPTAEPIPVSQEGDSSEDSMTQVPSALQPMEETSLAISKNAPAYTPGTLTDTGYESQWLGVRFTAPEGTVLTASENSGCEMICQDESQTCNVMVLVEDLPADFQIVDTFVKQFAEEIASEAEPAYKLLSDKEEVQIGSNTFRSVSFSASYNGVDLYQTYFIYFTDDKLASIVITYTDDSIETAGALISGFQAY